MALALEFGGATPRAQWTGGAVHNGPLRRAKGRESSPEAPKPILEQDSFTRGVYLTKEGLSSDAVELITLGGYDC